ncbi:MAG: RNA 2',3'-cyclic phosphodiesterase [Nitrospirae bacterium]|nr:RNA 2',3'-cyclic phosphodiesterase [Nitrospirota bacterium]
MVRSFIAVNLTKELKTKIANDISCIKYLKGIKWISPENLHITLKFLGDISVEDINGIKQILSDIASKTQPFEISLNRIGCFPNIKHPNVVWIGINDNGRLSDIFRDIDYRLSEIDIKKDDRSFSPHLTIGRIKDNIKIYNLKAEIERFEGFTFGSNIIDTISLMRGC